MSGVVFEAIESPDYSGVVLQSGEWRVIAGPSGKRYWLQRREGETFVGIVWRKLPGALASVLPSDCPISAAQVSALPACAADAAPEAVERRRTLNEAFRLTDYRRDDYGRVVATDDAARLAVDPSGEIYLLQRKYERGPSEWRAVASSKSASGLRDNLVEENAPWDPRLRFDRVRSDQLCRVLDSLPEVCRDGEWPELPERPETARERAQEPKSVSG